MSRSDDVMEVFQECFHSLRKLEGDLWKEVKGELQLTSEECPFWILLYENSDIAKCHAEFGKVMIPAMPRVEPLQFTVAYKVLQDEFEITLDTFMDNDEIREAVGSSNIGSMPDVTKRSPIRLFSSESSGLRPEQV